MVVNENPCNAFRLYDTIAAGNWQQLASEFLWLEFGVS